MIAAPLAAGDVAFDPAITQSEFQQFARTIGQAIYATPVQPARVTGLTSFDVGVAATIISVDTGAGYWRRAVPSGSGLTRGGYVAVPRLVVSKGFGAGTIAASYAEISHSRIKTYGAAIDLPIVRGGLAAPELALRGSYATLSGVDALKLKTYGVELFLSKGFGPLMPYAAVGKARTSSRGTVRVAGRPIISLSDLKDGNRYTVGVRLSLFVPKLVIEATQAGRRTYAAKISVGF